MFTGIVQAMGRVAAVEPSAAGARLIISPPPTWPPDQRPLAPGESIAVGGVCLTLVTRDARGLAFDVVGETLARTTLGKLRANSPVNLETCLTANTPMGGHFVQGHVDGVGIVTRVHHHGDDYRLAVRPPAELSAYIVPKGSVSIDGVSLTIASVTAAGSPRAREFDVALIPTTLTLTTLGALREGDPVNLETDIISKTIVHWLESQGPGPAGPSTQAESERLTEKSLRAAGFIP